MQQGSFPQNILSLLIIRIYHWGLILIFFTSFVYNANSQSPFRVKADFSIKERSSDSNKGLLIVGKVLYDKNHDKLIYNITFPTKELWVFHDTLMYKINNDTILSKSKVLPFTSYSYFRLLLDQQLNDFGLSKGGYSPINVQQAEDQIVTTWQAPEQIRDFIGQIKTTLREGLLYTISINNTEAVEIGKQYFVDYNNVNGLPIPHKIVQANYGEEVQIKRILTFRNIIINDLDENDTYDPVLSEFIQLSAQSDQNRY